MSKMIDLIYTAADNKRLLALCEEANWQSGLRSDKHPYRGSLPIHFIDLRYKGYDFTRHLALVQRLRPRYATVPDLSAREVSLVDITRARRQAEALAPYCGTLFYVPKLSGQIALLPKDAAIGYSVPSSYGAAQYPLWELEGHRVHLLGGSPHMQFQLYRYISCFAVVKSLDGNMHQKMSGKARFWDGGRWLRHPQHGANKKETSYECIAWSLANIRQAWLSFLEISRCPLCSDGLGLNRWCAWCLDAYNSIQPIAKTLCVSV